MTNKEYIERRDELIQLVKFGGLVSERDGFDQEGFERVFEGMVDQLINDIAFAAMESCEPDCDELTHAINQGSWDTMNRIEQIVGADEEN